MARSITVAFLILGLTLCLLSGCTNVSRKWYGEWEGDLNRANPSIPDDDVKRTVNLLRIWIRPDGTFEMLESGVPMSGTYRLGATDAVLTVKEQFGRRIEDAGTGTRGANKDLTLKWKGDGTIVWHDPGGFDGRAVTLRLKAQPP